MMTSEDLINDVMTRNSDSVLCKFLIKEVLQWSD